MSLRYVKFCALSWLGESEFWQDFGRILVNTACRGHGTWQECKDWMDIVRCAVVIQRSCLSFFRVRAKFVLIFTYFKQKKKEKRKTWTVFWLLESPDVDMEFRSVVGAAHGIGQGTCLFFWKEICKRFPTPYFWSGMAFLFNLSFCHLV